MFWRSKLNIALAVLPIILLWPLFYAASWRPHAINGADHNPTQIEGLAAAITYGPDGTLICSPLNGTLQRYLPSERRWNNFNTPTLSLVSDSSAERATPRLLFSGDGKTVFTPASLRILQTAQAWPRVIQAFDVASREPLYSFGNPVNDVFDISRDGQRAAYADSKGLVILDLNSIPRTRENQTKALPKALTGVKSFRDYPSRRFAIKGTVRALAFSPDSRVLAVGFNDQIALFDMDNDSTAARLQVPLNQQQQHNYAYNSPTTVKSPVWLEWSPDGSKLASYGASELAVFNATLTKIAHSTIDTNYIMGGSQNRLIANIVWTKTGDTLLTGGSKDSRWRLE